MRSDFNLKRDVEDELRSDPDIDSTDIAVAVKDDGFPPPVVERLLGDHEMARHNLVPGLGQARSNHWQRRLLFRLPSFHSKRAPGTVGRSSLHS